MKINKKYGVRIPATTANIGSGFDTLGMALGLYNEAYFTPVNELSLMESHIDIQGEGAGKIKPGADNMVLQAMQGKKNAEIAAELSISEGTVHTLKKTAYKKLRDRLQEHFYLLLFWI